jgi:DNA replication and repair protein RecF
MIVGPNASGKTNLLEAVLVIASGKSYRAKDSELVQFEQPWARLDGYSETGAKRTVKVEREPLPTKSYEIDGKSYKRLTMNHALPVVLFEPNHLQLLTGSPEQRRSFLDDLLEQTIPGYGSLRRQYRRTLAQRNALLKQDYADHRQMFPWDIRLSQLAGQIVRARAGLLTQLDSEMGPLYKDLSKTKTVVQLSYNTQFVIDSYESQLLRKLETTIVTDRMRGFTTHGPHRDDFVLSYDGRTASETASRGETRSAVLALKILELQNIEAARMQTPLLLLDDVFSELDSSRRSGLTEHLSRYQTFITTTDADTSKQSFSGTVAVIQTKL